MDHAARLKLFDAVWAEHGQLVEAALWRLTGDRERFGEALQESLLQIWRHLDKLQGPSARAYLYRIGRSAAAQAWRKRAGSRPDVSNDQPAAGDRPDELASRREMIAAVRRAISELPEPHARAITLRYLEQKEYDAIAREMECPPATTRTYVSRGLAALRCLPALIVPASDK